MKAIVIGAGGPTRQLLRRLSDRWEITVIESSPEVLERARGIRPIRAVRADGTSRLVLEKAGLSEAYAIVAVTNEDDSNLEICRLAAAARVRRIMAVVADPERAAEYEAIGVTAFSPDGITARRIEETLEIRETTSHPFARGLAEAIEFEVSPRAPMCGRPLKEIQSRSWIVGSVLRRGRLLIPHGETALEPGDLITVMATAAEFADLVRAFTSGEPRFPLDFGKNVAVALQGKQGAVIPEAGYLVRNSRAAALQLVHRDEETLRDQEDRLALKAMIEGAQRGAEGVEILRSPVRTAPLRSLAHIARTESVGVFAIASTARLGLLRLLEARRRLALARTTARPVLVARGSFPYRRILCPARQTPAGREAASAAIDLAVRSKAELAAVAAVNPLFLAGPAAAREGEEAIGWMEEEAGLSGLHLDGQLRHGNPVRTLLDASREADLLVLGISGGADALAYIPVAAHIVAACRSSVLLIPVRIRNAS
jgi:Trk K+ transport system NAD-binding subunit